MENISIEAVDSIQGISLASKEKNTTYFTRPLYHGSRQRALELRLEERQALNAACQTVIVFVRDHWKSWLSWDGLDAFLKANPDLTYFAGPIVQTFTKISNFQYGDFYLTTGLLTAWRYSKNPGGELLRIAQDCAAGIERLGIPITEPTLKDDLALVLAEAEKEKASDRVILLFEKVAFADLLTETGYKIDLDPDSLDFDFYETYESKMGSYSPSFRFKKNRPPYRGKLLKGKALDEAFQTLFGASKEEAEKWVV
jgi:hypothetical protein